MTRMGAAFRLGLFVAALVFSGAAGQAQVARVFVSVNGNDGNTCSNVATPCRTFGGGIAQVDPGGELIVLDTGSYGGVTITKSVTINVGAGVLAYTKFSVTIIAPGATVILRGLTIDGASGSGIDASLVGALFVDNCVVNGSSSNGLNFGNAGYLFIKDSIFRNNGGTGMAAGTTYAGSITISVDGCRFENNAGSGFYGGRATASNIRNSVASRNSGDAGFFVESSGELNADHCMASGNNSGFAVGSGASPVVRVANSTATDNQLTGFLNVGGTIESLGNNLVRGNGTNISGIITVISGN